MGTATAITWAAAAAVTTMAGAGAADIITVGAITVASTDRVLLDVAFAVPLPPRKATSAA